MKHRIKTTLATVAIAIALPLMLAVVVFVANRVHVGALNAYASEGGSTYVSIAIVIAGAVVSIALFTSLLAIGIDDYWLKREISALYLPILLFSASISAYMSLTTLAGLDLISHGGRLGWNLTNDPELRIVYNLLLAAVFVGLGWTLAVLLRGRDWSTRDVLLLFLAVAAIAGWLATLPFALT